MSRANRKRGPNAVIHRAHRHKTGPRSVLPTGLAPQYKTGPRFGQQLAFIRAAGGVS